MKIYAVGPQGSYGSQFAQILDHNPFGVESRNIKLCGSHQEVFNGILNDDDLGSVASIAILPIENSIELLVGDVVRLWMNQAKGASHLHVIGERVIRINHQLLVRPELVDLKLVKKVMSHPQALGQCSKYLDKIGVDIRIPTSSTAEAAQRLARDSSLIDTAVIASGFAASIYSLVPITKDRISNYSSNETRFHIIGWLHHLGFGANNKSAMIIWLKDGVGTLNNVTSCFRRHKVNISCIHSMSSGTLGKYAFYIEVDYNIYDDDGLKIQQELRKVTDRIKIIGSFHKNPIAIN
jgi:prephenate dehydratase